jgi:hypothetical protein
LLRARLSFDELERRLTAEPGHGMASRILARFGEAQGTDAEVQFDEGELKGYIVVMRFFAGA